MSVKRTNTKTILNMEDDSGVINVVQWVDEDIKENKDYNKDATLKVIGCVRLVTRLLLGVPKMQNIC